MTEGDLKQEIKEYLDKEYCCEFKEECKDGIRIRCVAYEAKLYLILRFVVQRKKSFIDGYNEGLKAKINFTTISDCPIKFEWHDLRKNPRDLPTEDCKDYLAIALDDTEPGVFMYIASEQGQWEWEPRRIAFYTNDQIKAWCEIPTFEEDA